MQKQVTNDFYMTSVGTDGTDGPTDAAGAYVDNILLNKVKESALDLRPFLDQFDSYHFFKTFDGLIKTGPTQTNVIDIIIVLIKPK